MCPCAISYVRVRLVAELRCVVLGRGAYAVHAVCGLRLLLAVFLCVCPLVSVGTRFHTCLLRSRDWSRPHTPNMLCVARRPHITASHAVAHGFHHSGGIHCATGRHTSIKPRTQGLLDLTIAKLHVAHPTSCSCVPSTTWMCNAQVPRMCVLQLCCCAVCVTGAQPTGRHTAIGQSHYQHPFPLLSSLLSLHSLQ